MLVDQLQIAWGQARWCIMSLLSLGLHTRCDDLVSLLYFK